MKKINKNSTLKEVLEVKGAEKVLEKFDFPCLHCPMMQSEIKFLKIGEVCESYGIDLGKVLEDLGKLGLN